VFTPHDLCGEEYAIQDDEGSSEVTIATVIAASSPRDKAKNDSAETVHTSSNESSCDDSGANWMIASKTVLCDLRVDLRTE
jgi:hypothetical protein